MDSHSQDYYWTDDWQMSEQEACQELDAGQGLTFADPADAIHWLLSPDENG